MGCRCSAYAYMLVSDVMKQPCLRCELLRLTYNCIVCQALSEFLFHVPVPMKSIQPKLDYHGMKISLRISRSRF